jgi:hypothetical protein
MKNIFNKVILKVRWTFRIKDTIPDINEKRQIIDMLRKEHNLKVMLETGTFMGDTVEYFREKFNRIISIELSEELATKAKARFAGDMKINILQGDSSLILAKLLKDIQEPVLFWLDGHYSSEFFIGDEFIKTAKGENNTPILKELDIIFQSGLPFLILIDDARLFSGSDDYPTIDQVKKQVKRYRSDARVFVEKDIIHII